MKISSSLSVATAALAFTNSSTVAGSRASNLRGAAPSLAPAAVGYEIAHLSKISQAVDSAHLNKDISTETPQPDLAELALLIDGLKEDVGALKKDAKAYASMNLINQNVIVNKQKVTLKTLLCIQLGSLFTLLALSSMFSAIRRNQQAPTPPRQLNDHVAVTQ